MSGFRAKPDGPNNPYYRPRPEPADSSLDDLGDRLPREPVAEQQREVLELFGEQPVVPGRELAQPVVTNPKSPLLGRGQVIEAQGRHLGHSEFAGGQEATLPGDDIAV